MKIFCSRIFTDLAQREGLTEFDLCQAMSEMRAGLIDAQLGSGLVKKRIARGGKGKSGGWRALLAFKAEQKAFFLYLFPKNQQDNITPRELQALRRLAKFYLSMNMHDIQAALENKELYEVHCHEK